MEVSGFGDIVPGLPKLLTGCFRYWTRLVRSHYAQQAWSCDPGKAEDQ